MSARPKARHVLGDCEAHPLPHRKRGTCRLWTSKRRRYSKAERPVQAGRCPHCFGKDFPCDLHAAPAPQEKGAEEPGGCPTCGLDCKGHETRTSADCAAMVTYGITPRRCTKRATVGPLCSQHAKAPATVPLPLSLVERAVEVFGAVEFSALGGRRCPVCSGWNMSENGETDRVHTKDCALRSVLAELRTYVGDGGK